jgi:uncharacterized membrane protein YfcA
VVTVNWFFLTTALACAGFVQSLTGFGFGLASMSLMPLYAAIWLGHWALQRIHPTHMRKGIFAFIGVSGAYYLILH